MYQKIMLKMLGQEKNNKYCLGLIQEIIWRRIKWICHYSSILNIDQLVVEGLPVSVDVDYIDSMNTLALLLYRLDLSLQLLLICIHGFTFFLNFEWLRNKHISFFQGLSLLCQQSSKENQQRLCMEEGNEIYWFLVFGFLSVYSS